MLKDAEKGKWLALQAIWEHASRRAHMARFDARDLLRCITQRGWSPSRQQLQYLEHLEVVEKLEHAARQKYDAFVSEVLQRRRS